ncbi:MAG: extracellular solute-binding protein [Deltaproteobacteria bacterium]|nr:extracellular solute-binding protein [Deltaproteobacteria bacterium]
MTRWLLILGGIWVLGGNISAARTRAIVLEFWNGFTGPDGKYIQRIVDAFNEEYQGQIRVNMVVMRWDDFYSKLALALRTKRGPNIGVVHYDNVYSVINQGIVEELDEYLNNFVIEDFVNSLWRVSLHEGHQYGIPLDFHPLVFYWNKDLFTAAGLDPEKPPGNREEFLAACAAIKQAGLKKNGQEVWPCMIPCTWPHFLLWQHIFFCNGGRMFNRNCTQATYDSAAGADALQFLWDLIYQYKYSPPHVMGIPGNEGKESFCRGTAAMLLEGIWMINAFEETKGLNFGAKAALNLGTGEHRIWSGGHSYEWAQAGMIPARYSVLSSKKFKEIPYLPTIAADVDRFTFPVAHYRYTEGIQPLLEYLNLCLLNKILPSRAIAKAAWESTVQLQQDPD